MNFHLQQHRYFIIILHILCLACTIWCRAANPVETALASIPLVEETNDHDKDHVQRHGKQLFVFGSGKETSPPNFVRLVVMRLIYGLAATMGLEERLEDVFNGAFVPPNADDGFFGFGGGGGGDDDGGFFDDY